ncbi:MULTISPECIES: restriction endonuclease subunit S [Enterobacteriaceae]|uniref:Restriction endonuclease subunit S n=1 Tax=Citrobacter bitternis TaxID=1585982 RepID=A0ABW1PWC1_9ENTR|nr:restriction endonuclease subunit S [Kosakonia sacchari]QHM94682.1 restriction endonuclease subunit S [Kosakonia sacchari]
MEQVLYQLPDGWEWHSVKKLSHNIQYGHTAKAESSGNAKFLRITDIQDGKIDWQGVPTVSLAEKEIRKYSLRDNDLVFARSGATAGKSILIKNAPTDAVFASYLIRIIPNQEKIIPEYLSYFFLTPAYWDVVGLNAAGAAQPNINGTKLSEFIVPIAPREEQKCIVEKLDALLTRINTAIEYLQESITLANALYASELNSVFSNGDDKWPLRKLNEVAEVARGKSKHRPRNDKSLFGGDYPFIQTGDVRNAQKQITNFSTSYNEKGLQQSKLWPKGTICLTIAANIGDVAILGMDACFPDSIVGISSPKLETDYLYYFLTTLQQQLDNKANAAAQKNINLKILSEIEIPVPTLNEQRDIVRKINAVDQMAVRVKTEFSAKITLMQQLKASILDSAFKGEL